MWSYAYKVPDDHIIMNDLAILNTNEIVLYGSIYKGLKESSTTSQKMLEDKCGN